MLISVSFNPVLLPFLFSGKPFPVAISFSYDYFLLDCIHISLALATADRIKPACKRFVDLRAQVFSGTGFLDDIIYTLLNGY